MKVLRLIGSMDPKSGGPCQGIRNAVSELNKLGIDTEVACLDDPTATFLGSDPFIVHALGPGQKPWHYSPHLLPWLLANLLRYDVVIVHGLWQYHSYAARKARQQLIKSGSINIPKLYIMPHGHLDPWFQVARSRRLKAIRNVIYWRLIEQYAVRDADGLLFTTNTELQQARLPFKPYHPKREINVGYGIQAPPVYTSAMQAAFFKHYPLLGTEPYLLFLSRIHEKKGVDLLIEAYQLMLKHKGIKMPKLVIAGPGLDTPFGQKVEQLVQTSSLLRQQVFFTGMLTGDAKWGAVYGCEAFVLPSHQENFGIAIVEALACGKPVLISDQVNIWPEIAQEKSALVQPNTTEGTLTLLRSWCILSDSLKQAMGKKAKQTFHKYFSVETAAITFRDAIVR